MGSAPTGADDAVYILNLCDRFKCLPSALFAEDDGLFRLLEIEALIRPTRVDAPQEWSEVFDGGWQ
jgi:hypothetical protein